MSVAFSHLNGKLSFSALFRSNSCSSFSCSRPMIVATARDQSYWASIQEEIEAHLKKAIPIRPPVSVFEPMHHLTFAPARTTAPALCIAACEVVGGDREQAMAAAAAIHLMHAAAYIHENLELTDRDRPKPIIQHKFGPNIELLTGDGIMSFGFELLARSIDPTKKNYDKILRVIIEITRAIGAQGVVGAQFLELEINKPNREESSDIELIEYICKKKEGELHACGAACGAILGGGSEEEIENLRKYGLYFGMILGMLYGVGRNEKRLKEKVEKLRELAINEVKSFNTRKVDIFYSLIELEPNVTGLEIEIRWVKTYISSH